MICFLLPGHILPPLHSSGGPCVAIRCKHMAKASTNGGPAAFMISFVTWSRPGALPFLAFAIAVATAPIHSSRVAGNAFCRYGPPFLSSQFACCEIPEVVWDNSRT